MSTITSIQARINNARKETKEAISEARRLIRDDNAPTYHSMEEYHAALAGDE